MAEVVLLRVFLASARNASVSMPGLGADKRTAIVAVSVIDLLG